MLITVKEKKTKAGGGGGKMGERLLFYLGRLKVASTIKWHLKRDLKEVRERVL